MTAESPVQDGDALVDRPEGEITAYSLSGMVSVAGAADCAGTLREADYVNWQGRRSRKDRALFTGRPSCT